MSNLRGRPLTLPHPGGGRYLNPNIGEPRLDPGETRAPTLASDEDMDVCFVLVDDLAPTAEAARSALIEQAPPQWGMRVDPEAVELPEKMTYKWVPLLSMGGEAHLIRCDPDDPDRDSDWWVFTSIAGGDWEITHAA